jgi:hypothetical protein
MAFSINGELPYRVPLSTYLLLNITLILKITIWPNKTIVPQPRG